MQADASRSPLAAPEYQQSRCFVKGNAKEEDTDRARGERRGERKEGEDWGKKSNHHKTPNHELSYDVRDTATPRSVSRQKTCSP